MLNTLPMANIHVYPQGWIMWSIYPVTYLQHWRSFCRVDQVSQWPSLPNAYTIFEQTFPHRNGRKAFVLWVF